VAFRFRYQRILDVRRQQEKAKAQEVAQRQAAIFRQRRRLGELEQMWRKERQTWLDAGTKGTSARQLQIQISVLDGLQRKIERARTELAELTAQLNQARNELVELVKQRKVFEKLEERDRAAYEARQNRLDQMVLDEIATARQWREQLEQTRSRSDNTR